MVDQRVEETLRENSLHLRELAPLPEEYPEAKYVLVLVLVLVLFTLRLVCHAFFSPKIPACLLQTPKKFAVIFEQPLNILLVHRCNRHF